jgi:hypothetical protein
MFITKILCTALATLTLASSVAIADIQVFPWPYCVYYGNEAKETRVIYANTEAQATITMSQIIEAANRLSVRLGYPGLWSATPGSCPPKEGTQQ